jgi:hypothetical protein
MHICAHAYADEYIENKLILNILLNCNTAGATARARAVSTAAAADHDHELQL